MRNASFYTRLLPAVILAFAAFSVNTARAVISGWDWAKIGAHLHLVQSCGVAVGTDDLGNVCIYGLMYNQFRNTSLTFGSVAVSNPNAYSNAVLVKYSPAGTALWGFNVQGNSNPIGLTTDSHGNAYIFCDFYDSVVFGTTVYYTTSKAYFIAKISPAGTLLWCTQDGTGCEGGFLSIWHPGNNGGIKTDSADNIYIASYYKAKNTVIGPYTLTNADTSGITRDLFIAKYNPEGNVMWAKGAGGTKDDFLRAFGVSASGRAGIAGIFYSPSIVFGSTTITDTSAIASKMYIAEYDASGNPLWAQATGKNKFAVPWNWANCIAYDRQGNLYFSGFFSDTLLIGGATIVHPGPGDGSMFLMKIDTAHHVQWHKVVSAPASIPHAYAVVRSLSLTVDQCGLVWAGGTMSDNGSLPFPYVNITGSHAIDSATKINFFPLHLQNPGFIAAFNAAGGYVGGKALQSGFGATNFIDCAPGGTLYLAGEFGEGYLIAGADTYIDTSYKPKFMLAKYRYDTLGCASGHTSGIGAATTAGHEIDIFPNPASNECFVQCESSFARDARAEVYDIAGQLILTTRLLGSSTVLSLAGISTGIYQCRIMNGGQMTIKKLVVMR